MRPSPSITEPFDNHYADLREINVRVLELRLGRGIDSGALRGVEFKVVNRTGLLCIPHGEECALFENNPLVREWCRGPESNWLRPPFQGGALPLSYPGICYFKIVLAIASCVNSRLSISPRRREICLLV
jgi:hypothetical protein